jgi:hypothetical protein
VQITIVQCEIEQAIRDYVGSKLKIAEGMEMTIELIATRGAEGFKATIDVHTVNPEPKPMISAPALVTPKPVSLKMPNMSVTTHVSEPEEAEVVEKKEEPPFTSEPEASVNEEAQDSKEAPVKEVFAEANPKVESPFATSSTPGNGGGSSRPLFRGLTKPKNT